MKTQILTLVVLLFHCSTLFAEGPLRKVCALPNGTALSYREAGSGSGTPIILLHGYTDTGRSFEGVVDALLEMDSCLRILIPDMRGHGATRISDSAQNHKSPLNYFSIDAFSEDILHFMDQLELEKVWLAGHSLGSIVSQRIALGHPDRINGMVLIAPIISGGNNEVVCDFVQGQMVNEVFRKAALEKGLKWPEEVYGLTPADLGNEVTKFVRDNWVTEPATDEAFLNEVAKETMAIKLATWIGAIHNIRAFDHRKALEKLRVPTLVLYSTGDPVAPARPAQADMQRCLRMAARNGNAKLSYKAFGLLDDNKASLPNTGHNFHWAVPEAVAADIVSFVRSFLPVATHTYLDDQGLVVTVPSKENILVLPQESARAY